MSNSNFLYAPQQWRTVEQFRTHIRRHNPAICDWVKGTIIHHTASPTISAWRGLQSINDLKNYYERIGWPSGPHLFICAGAPNPAHDGIFQLSPLNMTGTHARQCNSTTWGIEVVGNYSTQPWSDATMSLVIGTVAQLMTWRGIAINRQTIRYHKECVSDTACPGAAVINRFDWYVEGIKWRATNA